MSLQTATPKSYRLARLLLRGRAWGWYLSRLHKTEKRWNHGGSTTRPLAVPGGVESITSGGYTVHYPRPRHAVRPVPPGSEIR